MILTDPTFLPYFIIDDSSWNNLLSILMSKYRDLQFEMFWNLSTSLSLCHFMIVISTWMNLITLYAYLRSFFLCRLQFYFFLYYFFHHHLYLERILFPWSFVLFPPLFSFLFFLTRWSSPFPSLLFGRHVLQLILWMDPMKKEWGKSRQKEESSKPYDTRQTTEHRTHNSMRHTSRHNFITRILELAKLKSLP